MVQPVNVRKGHIANVRKIIKDINEELAKVTISRDDLGIYVAKLSKQEEELRALNKEIQKNLTGDDLALRCAQSAVIKP